ncbi:armadillo-type protein [Zychaea mexicana]|uniref:armadillo-type protein n=1 Tax=Zychaea mexicana TaxID=64656 RepID=UPI0022FEF13C|nr:armadillo-type protein [Zychaea mexicana]KAI9495182.1 armadillo-type protein [Zychaea mexicana]
MANASVAQVLEALSALYSASDPQAKNEASRWLNTFQKQQEAWGTVDYLLKADDSNTETRLFAAQTFRQKITYDLRDLEPAARLALRDSLVERLTVFATGPKPVMLQLCLALADLAIQLSEWKTAVKDMVAKFGGSPDTAVCLLEFLTVLPEELNTNTRLPLTDHEYKEQGVSLLESNSGEVLKLLIMYMQSSAGNIDLQERVFKCLSSWLRAGDVDIAILGNSPLMSMAFEALDNEQLFDVAVDLGVEIIFETRDFNATTSNLVRNIYQYMVPLLDKIREAKEEEDSDKVRGYCRLFVSAGEAYVPLIIQHPDDLNAILEGIMLCTAYNDLEIVPITFKFWDELTYALMNPRNDQAISTLSRYYDALVDIIIQHLHYPDDVASWSAKERDDFKDFRHDMGDTLKDCCKVLKPAPCLTKPLLQLQKLLTTPNTKWQQIEAPIFSLRAMGAQVPDDEEQVMPQIQDLLSRLPDHPKIRYAATLVISRYTFWTRTHPQYITYQLNFISAGFQNEEVAAASALALKHLCKDCNELLIDYLSELHPFYTSIIRTLPFIDALEVTEAIAHVLAVVPVSNLQNALQQFCLPLAQDLHSIAIKEGNVQSRDDHQKACDLLELIAAFISIIHPDVPLGQPNPCVNFVNELWPIFDLCLKNLGTDSEVCEQLGKCFKSCVQSYRLAFVPLLPQLMDRLVTGFQLSGFSVYLFVSYRIIREYAEGGEDNAAVCFSLVERLSQIMLTKANNTKFDDMPDVVEEYFGLLTALLEAAPTHLLHSTLFPTVFQLGFAGLSMGEVRALSSVIVFYRRLLGIALSVDELVPADATRTAASIGQNGAQIIEQFRNSGSAFVRLIFTGLIYHYTWDVISDIASIIKSLAQILPLETSEWVVAVVSEIPETNLAARNKNEFLTSYMGAINEKQWAKARRVLSDFITSYRRKNAIDRTTE